jgi:putative polyketide hydroxylase
MLGSVDDADVLIVGAGPAGLVAGNALSRYGVRTVLVEKRTALSTLSRATVISTRCMEIFRSWGLEDAISGGAADVQTCGWITPTLASGEGVAIEVGYPSGTDWAATSPTRPAWAPQDHLEPLLFQLLEQAETCEIRLGREMIGLEQSDAGLVATIRDQASGETETVRSQYLVGADGAHSSVRKAIGVDMEGPDALAEYQMVQFTAPLSEAQGKHCYGLNIITHPDAPGVLVARGRGERWGYAREWRPGQERLDECSEQRLLDLITTATGVPDLEPAIERVSTFRFAAQLANHFRNGRCFLVGDAAHRMTPRGGTGMNTAIQDGYDIAWKLGWVIRGWCDQELLDSYEWERRPVAEHNVARSADPNGAQNGAADALTWDLNGRLPHRWLEHHGETMSTLDLLGEGVTVFRSIEGPTEDPWPQAMLTTAPTTTHTLDDALLRDLGRGAGDTLLLRPDGRAWAPTNPA